MVVQCCACKRVRTETAWVEVANPEEVGRYASHGYCPTCIAKAYADFAVQLKNQQIPPAA